MNSASVNKANSFLPLIVRIELNRYRTSMSACLSVCSSSLSTFCPSNCPHFRDCRFDSFSCWSRQCRLNSSKWLTFTIVAASQVPHLWWRSLNWCCRSISWRFAGSNWILERAVRAPIIFNSNRTSNGRFRVMCLRQVVSLVFDWPIAISMSLTSQIMGQNRSGAIHNIEENVIQIVFSMKFKLHNCQHKSWDFSHQEYVEVPKSECRSQQLEDEFHQALWKWWMQLNPHWQQQIETFFESMSNSNFVVFWKLMKNFPEHFNCLWSWNATILVNSLPSKSKRLDGKEISRLKSSADLFSGTRRRRWARWRVQIGICRWNGGEADLGGKVGWMRKNGELGV
jgi:hypothetical protein